jgi:putative phosphoribosyl transferase
MVASAENQSAAGANLRERDVEIPADEVRLDAELVLPPDATGLVVFAHGSGSSRHSPRNRLVAEELQRGGLGTLLLDLLTEAEEVRDEATGELRFDIGLLAERLTSAVDWSETIDWASHAETGDLPRGLFGASTGAAAAIVAAANRPRVIRAVVSRGGRPDLARAQLPQVAAPTLLIVGGADREILELNRQALELLGAEKHLEIVEGATHLFEEAGALDRVADLARDWFVVHLAAGAPARSGRDARPGKARR